MKQPKRIHLGCTRLVILVGKYAFKFPNFRYHWSHFLRGLLCNMCERSFAATGWPELCPVVFSIRGGWLVVMPRVKPMTREEFQLFDVKAFCEKPDYRVPAEQKMESFGWLNGRIVAIDYGEVY